MRTGVEKPVAIPVKSRGEGTASAWTGAGKRTETTDLTEVYLVRLMRKMAQKNRSACAGEGTDGQAWIRSAV